MRSRSRPASAGEQGESYGVAEGRAHEGSETDLGVGRGMANGSQRRQVITAHDKITEETEEKAEKDAPVWPVQLYFHRERAERS